MSFLIHCLFFRLVFILLLVICWQHEAAAFGSYFLLRFIHSRKSTQNIRKRGGQNGEYSVKGGFSAENPPFYPLLVLISTPVSEILFTHPLPGKSASSHRPNRSSFRLNPCVIRGAKMLFVFITYLYGRTRTNRKGIALQRPVLLPLLPLTKRTLEKPFLSLYTSKQLYQ